MRVTLKELMEWLMPRLTVLEQGQLKALQVCLELKLKLSQFFACIRVLSMCIPQRATSDPIAPSPVLKARLKKLSLPAGGLLPRRLH